MRPKRRVLFFAPSAFLWGGVQSWLDDVADSLGRAGWDVVVGLAKGPHFHDPRAYKRTHPSLCTIEVDARPSIRQYRVQAARDAIRRLRPDVVVPLNLVDPLEAAVREKLAGNAIRLVITHAGYSPGMLADLRSYAGLVDAAVPVNRLLARIMSAYAGVPAERIWLIPHGVPDASRTRRPADGPLRIGYVGRLEEREKRASQIVPFVHALEQLGTGFRLDVAGDGHLEDELRQALTAQSAAGTVRFFGKLTRNELYSSIYPELDCLVLFSPSEGSPHVVWQAMLHGVVPVVSCFRGCRAEGTLRHGQTAMVFPVGEPQRAARMASDLASDRALLASISQRARETSRSVYLSARNLAKWAEVLDAVVQVPPRLSPYPPSLQTPAAGRIEKWHVPAGLGRWLRARLHTVPEPSDPGDEWPHRSRVGDDEVKTIERWASELDRGENEASPDSRPAQGKETVS
jgi:glycosyltransferase involved in cell wall biosynthesis